MLRLLSCALVLAAAFAVLTVPQDVFANEAANYPFNLGWDGSKLYMDTYDFDGTVWCIVVNIADGTMYYPQLSMASDESGVNGVYTFVADLGQYGFDDNLLRTQFWFYGVLMSDSGKEYWSSPLLYEIPQRKVPANFVKKYTKPSLEAAKAVFDAKFYADSYDDLAVFNGDETKLLNHFRTYGIQQGRVASPYFDVKIYKSLYPDLQKAYGDDLGKYVAHYYGWGHKENRIGFKFW